MGCVNGIQDTTDEGTNAPILSASKFGNLYFTDGERRERETETERERERREGGRHGGRNEGKERKTDRKRDKVRMSCQNSSSEM